MSTSCGCQRITFERNTLAGGESVNALMRLALKAEDTDKLHTATVEGRGDVLDRLTPEEAWILRAYFGLAPFREHKSAKWLSNALCCGKRTVYRKVAELLRRCRENWYKR